MSVIKSVRPRKFLAALSVLFMVVGALFGANVASADSVQYQSYQRASQTEACAAQVGETPWQASWGADSSWKPSWEQWANKGAGGWVCTRSITWAKTPIPGSSSGCAVSLAYRVGDVGPGGGKVFYIDSASCLRYEMAPKTWSGAGTPDAQATWCDGLTDVPSANGTAVGTGAANTAAMAASSACSSDAAAAVLAYAPAGTTAGQWFLPSKDELNAMCNYSRNPTAPAAPSVSCYGSAGSTQDVTFAAGTYGFASVDYWSSSQDFANYAWYQDLSVGYRRSGNEGNALRVRPVRAF
ncbi:unannotated protein [freshwater metagenome]|uniref:Unannotated protein n=1 Tax=freshwater metagenome TaxID=449393 RepID=A0A6J7RPK0_9ZZZZ|nr:DUF1566 domain-containing protein [Actinomycetota bacterium]